MRKLCNIVLYFINLHRLAAPFMLFVALCVDDAKENIELVFGSGLGRISFGDSHIDFETLLFDDEISKNSKNPANLATTQSNLRLWVTSLI